LLIAQDESLFKAKRALVASGSFFSVMGIGWVFGLLTIENNIVAFQYLFGIFVGLQGFFIFYLYVCMQVYVMLSLAVTSGASRWCGLRTRANTARVTTQGDNVVLVLHNITHVQPQYEQDRRASPGARPVHTEGASRADQSNSCHCA
jgi:hypothetical protein